MEKSCWNCKHYNVMWITEEIRCNKRKDFVRPWAAYRCEDYIYE